MSDQLCDLCNVSRRSHTELEKAGIVHHQFSEGGQLMHSGPAQPKGPSRASYDPVLRHLLVEMGLITTDDLARKEVELRERVPDAPRVDG